jgi:hypothetical protein
VQAKKSVSSRWEKAEAARHTVAKVVDYEPESFQGKRYVPGGARFAILHMDDERLQLEFEGLLTWNSVKGDVIEEPSFFFENFSKFHDDAYEVLIDEGQYNHLDLFISPSSQSTYLLTALTQTSAIGTK